MNELKEFLNDICHIYKIDNDLKIEQAREIVKRLNEFLYCTYDNIGTVNALDEEFNYVSDFHKYWKDNYKEILNITIDGDACKDVAIALHDVYLKTNGQAFENVWDTFGLKNEEVCRVRFLTANQDFRGSRKFEELAKIFKKEPSIFDEYMINEEPETFIKDIDVVKLGQTDKRAKYAKTISNLLIENNCSPYELIEVFDNDIYKLREYIINTEGAGYGNKKTDMFLRDMVVLNIWNDVKNFDKIDVASDTNTIKIALHTGILKTSIPLVSSFLDIFCYQYSYVEKMNALAWRKVWEAWKEEYPNECLSSPCLLDYFIYNVVGKQFCKGGLNTYKCDEGHVFKWTSGIKRCQICAQKHIRTNVTLINKSLPCDDEEGTLFITKTKFYESNVATPNIDKCPFEYICNKGNTKNLNPPKSISILGQTGWNSAYTNKGEGGGGLMA